MRKSEIVDFLISEIPTFTKTNETHKSNFAFFLHTLVLDFISEPPPTLIRRCGVYGIS